MNKRHYEHTLPNIRGSLSNTYPATRVEKMTPLEFTANINDECFDDRNNWVRAIELPKQE